MKKLFGEIDLSWKKIIISAIVIGVLVGLLNSVPFLKDTSLTDSAIYFDLWILFGIFIIMNAKSNKEAAIKSFIFFLISQPLIYLVEVPFSYMGWQLFVYYKYWFIWTIFCLPMGFIGYYIKKDRWWGLLILLPMMLILGYSVNIHLNGLIYGFPRHLISYLFCAACLIIYPLVLFKNKKIKIVGLIIGILFIIAGSMASFIKKPVYSTHIMCSGGKYSFDETYKVYLEDTEYGDVSLEYISSIEDYCIKASFVKSGKTKFILEDADGNKHVFDLTIGNNTYDVEEIK